MRWEQGGGRLDTWHTARGTCTQPACVVLSHQPPPHHPAHLTLMVRRCPPSASAAVMSKRACSARTDSPGSSCGPIIVCVLLRVEEG